MERKETIEIIRNILVEHGVPAAYLFGSFARNERPYHDIDIAIEPPAGKFSLLDLVGLEQEIEDSTREKVDLVLYRALKPRLRANIERDKVPVL